jgi:hypothetical protein
MFWVCGFVFDFGSGVCWAEEVLGNLLVGSGVGRGGLGPMGGLVGGWS